MSKNLKGFQKGHSFQGWLGKKHKPETIEKMRAARLKNNPMHNEDSVRKRSETIVSNKLFAGSKDPNWKGGSRCYRGYGWKEAKNKRREIDNYTCQKCGKKEEPGKRKFDIHHIIDFKNGGTNEMDNLITVCRSCHNKFRNA